VATAEVWAYSEKPGLLGELISAARLLAGRWHGPAVALVIGPQEAVREAISLGADRVLWLGEKKGTMLVEDYVPTIAALVEEQEPAALLIGASKRGKAVAGRLAARVGASTITDAKEFIASEGKMLVRHMIFGGGAVRMEKPLSATALVTVGAGEHSSALSDPERGGDIVEVPFVEPAWQARCRERKERRPLSSVNLGSAERIVCPGRGIRTQEDLAMISELAQVLEAEIGCTRPLAEGLSWLPRECYIGVSGISVKPELYVGVGVSGQVQHTVGLVGAHIIVAINKDKSAPIFGQADYGVVGDLYRVVPAFIRALKDR